jgi:hypothetical protein
VSQHVAELPTFIEVLQKRLAPELGQDVQRMNAGVDKVAQDEVNDAILSPEWHGRLGPLFGQRIEACPFASGKNYSENSNSHGKAIVQ